MERLSPILEVNQTIMFGKFTNVELDAIIDAVKFARAGIANQNKREMRVGTLVKFTSTRTGQVVTGTVKKVNIKYILVNETGRPSTWRVPANMLEVA
jgi:hypothetical protein